MRKITALALSCILVAGLFAGCRRNNMAETTIPSTKPVVTTTAPTVHTTEATRATTEHTTTATVPHTTNGNGATDHSGATGATGATGESGQRNRNMPQY